MPRRIPCVHGCGAEFIGKTLFSQPKLVRFMPYVHGYTPREAERLRDQSGILEALLHSGTAYPAGCRVLEPGCGVGAQSAILARRHADVSFISFDLDAGYLAQARSRLKEQDGDRVHLARADLRRTSFPDQAFDHVYICFVLEHLQDPRAALLELKRVLKPGGTITVIEGDHGSCFWHPETRDSLTVWNAFIRVQQSLGHNPNIGRELAPLLRRAGYELVSVEPRWVYADVLDPVLLDGVVNRIIVPMVLSTESRVLDAGLVDTRIWQRGIDGIRRSGESPGGSFFYTWFKAVAVKPVLSEG